MLEKVVYCAGATPRSTQQTASKPLFHPKIVGESKTLWRRYYMELMDIAPLVIKDLLYYDLLWKS